MLLHFTLMDLAATLMDGDGSGVPFNTLQVPMVTLFSFVMT